MDNSIAELGVSRKRTASKGRKANIKLDCKLFNRTERVILRRSRFVEDLIQKQFGSFANLSYNNLIHVKDDVQQKCDTVPIEESGDNLLIEKPLANMKENRQILLKKLDNPDVPFTPPLIKITIGGIIPKGPLSANTLNETNTSDCSKVSPQRIAVVAEPTKAADVTITTDGNVSKAPRQPTRWKRKPTAADVIRVTSVCPIFSSAVLGRDTADKFGTLKRIKLCSNWQQKLISPDRPEVCVTPATASSGYTSECDSSEISPTLLSNENIYSFDSLSEKSITEATSKSICPEESKTRTVEPTPLLISIKNCVKPQKLNFNTLKDMPSGSMNGDFDKSDEINVARCPTPIVQRRVVFKRPQLPNTKRPPTRIKCWKDQCLGQLPRTQQDDAISIFAGSEVLGDEEPILLSKPTSASPDPFNNDTSITSPAFEYPEQQVEEEPLLPQLPVEPYEPENPIIKDWIASTTQHTPAPQVNVMYILRNVCRHFAWKGLCYRRVCSFNHELPSFFYDLKSLSENDFQNVFAFTVASPTIFKLAFDLILNYMSDYSRQDMILHFVSDIMKMRIDKMPYIEKVIGKLKNMGFTFEQAASEILTTIGRSNECLLDILLSFAVDEDRCIIDHWDLIQKLISFRKEKLDHGVVVDIFKKCVELDPPNKELCENIYKDLCVKQNFNLREVNKVVILKYIALLYHFQLNSFALYFSSVNSISIQEVQPYLLPVGKGVIGEVADEVLLSRSTSESSALITPVFLDVGEGDKGEEKVEELEKCSENSYNGYCSYDLYNRNVEHLGWNEFDLMEGERVQRECISETFATGSAIESKSTLPYFPAPQINNNAHSSTQAYNNSMFASTNGRISCSQSQPKMTPAQEPTSKTYSSSSQVLNRNGLKKDELADEDIILVVEGITKHNMSVIFTLMQKYNEPYKLMKSFVVHVITALKKLPSVDEFCTVIEKIFNCLGEKYMLVKDAALVGMLRLLGFNLLPRLDEIKCYKTACQIVDRFSKDLNSFTSVECFQRYKDALRLLKQPELKLLECVFSANTERMAEYKKRLVKEYMDICLKHSTSDAKDCIVFFMLNSRVEPAEDMVRLFNILMGEMLNNYSHFKTDLINMFDNIVNSWYKYLRHTILRAYLISTFYDLPDSKIMEFFLLCVDLGVYPAHEGIENSIMLPSNLVAEEIYLVIHYDLHKIMQTKFPINNLVIKAEDCLPKDEYSDLMTVLTNSELGNTEMIRRVLMVLKKLNHFPNLEKLDQQDGYVILPFHELHRFLQPYNQQKLPPLSKFR